MTKTDMAEYARKIESLIVRLTAERSRLRSEVLGDSEEKSASAGRGQYTTDDLSREDSEEEVALSVLGNEEQLLGECRAALDRIQRGTFGVCADCGKAIARSRLNAIPYATRCVPCASARENATH
jgi:DnaK suppressor protein